MGKIKEFIEKAFDDYRNDRITLRQLIISLSRYAERNIPYDWLWAIFEDEVNKQFNELGDLLIRVFGTQTGDKNESVGIHKAKRH